MPIKNEALAELAIARDEARLQAHLLSMEARERWRTLEAELDALERKLTDSGEHAAESAVASARKLTSSVVEFLKEHVQSGAVLSKPVASVMSREVRPCLPSDSLNRAAQLMWEANCGALPVVGPEGIIVGMLTDRDICMASYTQGRELSALTVEHAMSRGVKACTAEEPISRVLEIMQQSRVRRVPVLQSGSVIGMVALADVARFVDTLTAGRALACDALAKTVAAVSQAPASVANPTQARAAE